MTTSPSTKGVLSRKFIELVSVALSVQGVQACNLGVPILADELERSEHKIT